MMTACFTILWDISGNTVINGAPTGSKYNGLIVGDANVTDNGKN